MSKHNYKIGDKVKVIGNSQPMHHFEIGSIVTVGALNGAPCGNYGDIELVGKAKWQEENEVPVTQWLSLADISPIHTLIPGETYTMASGRKCRIIHIEDGLAYGFHLHSDGSHGPTAYAWNMDGVYQNATEEAGRDYRIVFEPVRETVTTKGSWAKKGQSQPNHYQYGISFDLINGIPDWSTAKVTPCA